MSPINLHLEILNLRFLIYLPFPLFSGNQRGKPVESGDFRLESSGQFLLGLRNPMRAKARL